MNQLDKCEYHSWPIRHLGGGQRTGRVATGVLIVHQPTGAAVAVNSERSQLSNRRLAEERIRLLLANLPWSAGP